MLGWHWAPQARYLRSEFLIWLFCFVFMPIIVCLYEAVQIEQQVFPAASLVLKLLVWAAYGLLAYGLDVTDSNVTVSLSSRSRVVFLQ